MKWERVEENLKLKIEPNGTINNNLSLNRDLAIIRFSNIFLILHRINSLLLIGLTTSVY